LAKYNLMGPDILLSHCNGMTSEEKSFIIASEVHVSSTPSTEMQMGLGEPVCFQDGISDVSSLGVDCHSATSSSMVDQTRLALPFSRSRHNQHSFDTNSPLSMKANMMDAFNLITIKGARAAGLADNVGSITVGKYADLVFWDKNTPGMLAAAEPDPVATIIHHSSLRDVRDVMIDGTFRRRGGGLLVGGLWGGKMLRGKYFGVEKASKSRL
jgi:cytosine/adenosine deaminase-related metal-dependent hydrolase